MTQLFLSLGLGTHGSSLDQLGRFGPKGNPGLGLGGVSLSVNAATGNGVLQQSDGFLSDFGVGLNLFQTYNTQNSAWQFNTDTRIACDGKINATGSSVTRTDEDGHQSRFVYDADRHAYIPQDGSTARLAFDGFSWRYQEGTGTRTCHYNLEGQLTHISDKDGHALQFHYDNGRLTRITDSNRQQSVTWRFEDGLLREVTVESEGQPVHHLHYDYDAHHRLNRVGRDLGDGRIYWIAYDYASDSNRINGIRQSDGTSMHLDYDATGRIKRLVDGEGRITLYDYQQGKTIVTNGLGESFTYYYDEKARLTGIDGPERHRIRYHYDGEHLDSITDGSQHWAFQYNEAGDCVRVESPTGQITERTYDAEHHLLRETCANQTARFVYDDRGHLRFEITPDGVVTEHRYDVNGNRVNSRCYLLTRWQAGESDFNTLTQWGALQNQQAIHLVDYRYDVRGSMSEEIHFTHVDENGLGVLTADTIRTYSRYDAAGRLVEQASVTAKGLSTTHFMYDDLGRLIQTIDNQNHTQTIEYDDVHQRILKTDANGLQTLSIYDKSGLLLSTHRLDFTHDFGTTTYQYDAAGQLVSETDVSGQTSYRFYDGLGRLDASISTSGHVTEYTYDDDGHCIQTHQYQQAVHLKGLHPATLSSIKPATSAEDRISQYVYNAHHQLAQSVNADGGVTKYQYDAEGRVTHKTIYAHRIQSDRAVVASSNDHTLTYYYDRAGRLQAEVNGDGAATAYGYDAEGHLTETIRYKNKVTGSYTGDWTVDAPVSANDRDIHTYSVYNAAGLKVADIDAERYLTQYTYDARGLLTERVAYATPLPFEMALFADFQPIPHVNDHRTTYRYNDLSQCIEERTANGLVTTYGYDLAGRVTAKTLTDAKTEATRGEQFRYDSLGRLTERLDARGVTGFAYDVAGHLIRQTNALNESTQFVYDNAGLVCYAVSATGAITETHYNAFQQVDSIIRYATVYPTHANMSLQSLSQFTAEHADARADGVTHFTYDAVGLLVRETQKNPNGRDWVKAYTHDALGRCITSTVDPEGLSLTTTYAYDASDHVIRQTDPNHHTTHFIYDTADRMRYRIDALGVVTEHRYDLKGNEQETITYARRVTRMDAYDQAILTALIQPEERLDHHSYFRFDAENRLVESQDGVGLTTVYRYDAEGNLIEKRQYDTPEGTARTTRFVYDGLNQKQLQIDGLGFVTAYTYDAAGQLIQQTRLNNRLTGDMTDGANIVFDAERDECTHYTYDAVGRLIAKVSAEGEVIAFTYDATGATKACHQYAIRLRAEQRNGPEWVYCIQESEEDRITRYEYDAAGRERFRIGPLGHVVERQYDAAGNVVAEINQARCTQFDYDAAGRLTKKTDAANRTTLYTYDANNNVDSKVDANQARWTYVYNEVNQLIETHAPVTSFNTYVNGVWRIDTRSVITKNDYDAFGNIKAVIRDAGGMNQTTQFTYDANNRLLQTIYVDVALNQASQTWTETNVYNAFGDLIEHRDKAGTVRFFFYNESGQQTHAVDGEGAVTGYAYDAFGNIRSKTRYVMRISGRNLDAITQNKQDRHDYYAYDKDHHLIEQRQDDVLTYNPRTRTYHQLPPTTRMTYTVFGELSTHSVRLSETDWATTAYAYHTDGTLRAKRDAAHYLTTYRYNDERQVVDEMQYATPTMDLYTQPISSTNDRHLSFTYDALGQLVTRTLHQVRVSRLTGKGSQYETTPRDLVSRYGYDALGHLVSTTDTEGFTAYSYYNTAGLLFAKIGASTPAGRPAVTYRYDALGQLLESHAWANGASAADEHEYTLNATSLSDVIRRDVYDAWGHVIEKIDGNGNSTHYSYNAAGLLARSWQEVHQADKSMKVVDKRYTYDNEHHLTQTALFNSTGVMKTDDATYNAFGEVSHQGMNGVFSTTVDYDRAGRVWRSNAEGKCRVYGYDLSANVTQVLTASNAALTLDLATIAYEDIATLNEGLLHRQDNTYDALGRLIAQDAQTQTVDRWGNLLAHTNANGFTTCYEYNALNALTKQQLPEVNVVDEHGITRRLAPVITYAVDGLGRSIAVTDANDHTKAYRLDAEGHVLEDIDARGFHRDTQYNALGQRTQLTNERGVVTSYTYDGENRLLSVHTPLTTQQNAYDEAGQLIRQTDAAGNSKAFTYDERGFQTQQTTGLGTTHFEYDAWGHKTTEIDASGHRNTWKYDDQGRVTEHTDLGGHRTNYAYNINGLLVEETGSTGKHQTRTYLSDGQLQTYKDWARQETVEFTYDPAGQVLTHTSERASVWAKVTDRYEYDAQGRVSRVSRDNTPSTSPVQSLQFSIAYEYDAAGNIRDTETTAHYENYNPIKRREYFCYDENNRLVINKGTLMNGTIDITQSQGTMLAYDATGNLHDTYVYEGVVKQHYQYDYNADNQVTRISRNGLDQQRMRFVGGQLVEKMVHNGYGNLTRQHRMAYSNGLLTWQDTYNENGAHVGSMGYHYDNVGNLTKLTIQECAIGSGYWYKEIHDYGYALWDGYLQSSDRMTYDMEHCATTTALSERRYDMNGLLENVTDTPTQTHSTDYYSSSLDGVVARKDNSGQTSYLTSNGKALGDLRIDKATKNQTLTTYVESATTTPPEDQPGLYTVNSGDTLEQIALQVYGDRSLWYLIADANGITERNSTAGEQGGQLHVGMRLKIPPTARAQHHTNDTHTVMSATDWTGNTAPTAGAFVPLQQSSAPPPNKHGNVFLRTLASIAVVVIAAAAMIMSAGVLAVITTAGASFTGLGASGLASLGISALGGSGVGLLQGIGIGFASGITSNVAGQIAAVALHQQNGIDFKGALMTGLATAATAGIAHAINTIPAYQPLRAALNKVSPNAFNVLAATEMMERDAASQALNIAIGQRQGFDWQELGVSAATAGIMGGQSMQGLDETLNQTMGKSSGFVKSQAEALVRGAASGHYDAVHILQDNLGNAVVDGLLQPNLGSKAGVGGEVEEGGYCSIPESEPEESFSAIPEGTWERFHREAKLRQHLQSVEGRAKIDDLGHGSELSNVSSSNLIASDNAQKIRFDDGFNSDTNKLQLATILMSEASVGNYAEQVAVGNTVLNRMHRNKTVKVEDVWSAYDRSQAPSKEMLSLAANLLSGKISDNTGGATHYYSPRSMPKEGTPIKGFDVGGGLERIAGRASQSYRPSFVNSFEYVNILDVRESYYKFYFSPGTGKVR